MPSFESFCAAYHSHFTRNPNRCVNLGVQQHLGELPDPSVDYQARGVAAARQLWVDADEVSKAELDFDQRLDIDLAKLHLQYESHRGSYRYNERLEIEQMPRAGDDIGDGIFQVFINDPRPAWDRLADIASRLEKIPDYLSAATARLKTPVERWVSMDREKVDGLDSLFDTLVDWAKAESFPDLARLVTARADAVVALARYSNDLAAMPTTTHFAVGPETAAELVRLRGVDLSLDELHEMATSFLNEVGETIDALRERLATRYELGANASVRDVQLELKRRYALNLDERRFEGVIERYQGERTKILGFIRERSLFPVPDDQDMLILRTPRFMEPSIPAGAMLAPPAFRPGVKRSLVYLTLNESLLPEHTELTIPNMMIHEGIPGHHLQLSTAAGHASVIRRHAEAMDLCEGWTTMLEDFMLDVGYMGDLTDEARFIGKLDVSRIGARVAIDIFFMTGDSKYLDVGVDCDTSSSDPFEAAGALLQAVTGFVPGRVQAELNWYSQERGYPLSYLTGNRLVWQLKGDLERAQAGRVDGVELDRLFHKTFLEAGNMPVPFLRRVFEHQGLIPAT